MREQEEKQNEASKAKGTCCDGEVDTETTKYSMKLNMNHFEIEILQDCAHSDSANQGRLHRGSGI